QAESQVCRPVKTEAVRPKGERPTLHLQILPPSVSTSVSSQPSSTDSPFSFPPDSGSSSVFFSDGALKTPLSAESRTDPLAKLPPQSPLSHSHPSTPFSHTGASPLQASSSGYPASGPQGPPQGRPDNLGLFDMQPGTPGTPRRAQHVDPYFRSQLLQQQQQQQKQGHHVHSQHGSQEALGPSGSPHSRGPGLGESPVFSPLHNTQLGDPFRAQPGMGRSDFGLSSSPSAVASSPVSTGQHRAEISAPSPRSSTAGRLDLSTGSPSGMLEAGDGLFKAPMTPRMHQGDGGPPHPGASPNHPSEGYRQSPSHSFSDPHSHPQVTPRPQSGDNCGLGPQRHPAAQQEQGHRVPSSPQSQGSVQSPHTPGGLSSDPYSVQSPTTPRFQSPDPCSRPPSRPQSRDPFAVIHKPPRTPSHSSEGTGNYKTSPHPNQPPPGHPNSSSTMDPLSGKPAFNRSPSTGPYLSTQQQSQVVPGQPQQPQPQLTQGADNFGSRVPTSSEPEELSAVHPLELPLQPAVQGAQELPDISSAQEPSLPGPVRPHGMFGRPPFPPQWQPQAPGQRRLPQPGLEAMGIRQNPGVNMQGMEAPHAMMPGHGGENMQGLGQGPPPQFIELRHNSQRLPLRPQFIPRGPQPRPRLFVQQQDLPASYFQQHPIAQAGSIQADGSGASQLGLPQGRMSVPGLLPSQSAGPVSQQPRLQPRASASESNVQSTEQQRVAHQALVTDPQSASVGTCEELPEPDLEGLGDAAGDGGVEDENDLTLDLDPDKGDDDLGNLDNLETNDPHLDDLLNGDEFDLLAYTDPELDQGDPKDVFSDQLRLVEAKGETPSSVAGSARCNVENKAKDKPGQKSSTTVSQKDSATLRPPAAESADMSKVKVEDKCLTPQLQPGQSVVKDEMRGAVSMLLRGTTSTVKTERKENQPASLSSVRIGSLQYSLSGQGDPFSPGAPHGDIGDDSMGLPDVGGQHSPAVDLAKVESSLDGELPLLIQDLLEHEKKELQKQQQLSSLQQGAIPSHFAGLSSQHPNPQGPEQLILQHQPRPPAQGMMEQPGMVPPAPHMMQQQQRIMGPGIVPQPHMAMAQQQAMLRAGQPGIHTGLGHQPQPVVKQSPLANNFFPEKGNKFLCLPSDWPLPRAQILLRLHPDHQRSKQQQHQQQQGAGLLNPGHPTQGGPSHMFPKIPGQMMIGQQGTAVMGQHPGIIPPGGIPLQMPQGQPIMGGPQQQLPTALGATGPRVPGPSGAPAGFFPQGPTVQGADPRILQERQLQHRMQMAKLQQQQQAMMCQQPMPHPNQQPSFIPHSQPGMMGSQLMVQHQAGSQQGIIATQANQQSMVQVPQGMVVSQSAAPPQQNLVTGQPINQSQAMMAAQPGLMGNQPSQQPRPQLIIGQQNVVGSPGHPGLRGTPAQLTPQQQNILAQRMLASQQQMAQLRQATPMISQSNQDQGGLSQPSTPQMGSSPSAGSNTPQPQGSTDSKNSGVKDGGILSPDSRTPPQKSGPSTPNQSSPHCSLNNQLDQGRQQQQQHQNQMYLTQHHHSNPQSVHEQQTGGTVNQQTGAQQQHQLPVSLQRQGSLSADKHSLMTVKEEGKSVDFLTQQQQQTIQNTPQKPQEPTMQQQMMSQNNPGQAQPTALGLSPQHQALMAQQQKQQAMMGMMRAQQQGMMPQRPIVPPGQNRTPINIQAIIAQNPQLRNLPPNQQIQHIQAMIAQRQLHQGQMLRMSVGQGQPGQLRAQAPQVEQQMMGMQGQQMPYGGKPAALANQQQPGIFGQQPGVAAQVQQGMMVPGQQQPQTGEMMQQHMMRGHLQMPHSPMEQNRMLRPNSPRQPLVNSPGDSQRHVFNQPMRPPTPNQPQQQALMAAAAGRVPGSPSHAYSPRGPFGMSPAHPASPYSSHASSPSVVDNRAGRGSPFSQVKASPLRSPGARSPLDCPGLKVETQTSNSDSCQTTPVTPNGPQRGMNVQQELKNVTESYIQQGEQCRIPIQNIKQEPREFQCDGSSEANPGAIKRETSGETVASGNNACYINTGTMPETQGPRSETGQQLLQKLLKTKNLQLNAQRPSEGIHNEINGHINSKLAMLEQKLQGTPRNMEV
ncbi:hypothetical protein XENOCAPTIV_002344, partial [Xenoophorus captivus]